MPDAPPTPPDTQTTDRPPDRPWELFISYSHRNEAVKDRLLTNLTTLKSQGLVRAWTDRAIPPGSQWRDEIESAMTRADGAIFLVEEYFLASGFCMDVEVPAFLQRRADEGVLVLFVLTQHCNWEAIDFIARSQMLPRDAKPMRDYRPQALAYTHVVQEIGKALIRHRAAHPDRGSGREETGGRGFSRSTPPISGPGPAEASTSGVDRLAQRLSQVLARLPGRTDRLFGRERELARLDAQFLAADGGRRGCLLWVAPGGMGKSALTRWWLEHHPWPAGTRFVGHSFYSQGSRYQSGSARGFLLAALAELGVEPVGSEAGTSDYDLGQRLAETAARAPAQAPVCLLLDGLEPLQQASSDPELNGSVKDQGLLGLLETLARAPGTALCLASSRLPVPDPGIADAVGFTQVELKALPADGARALLQARGVAGSDAELDAVAGRCARHPLALILAAEFVHTFLDDCAAAFLARPWPVLDEPSGDDGSERGRSAQRTLRGRHGTADILSAGRHAATIMAWFDTELTRGRQALDLELVHLLGLFERPAPWGALLALKRQDPPIPGLTQALHQADDQALAESLARLRQWGLVSPVSGGDGRADLPAEGPRERAEPDLDAHPLVREHFGARLETGQPEAWRAAHRVLFEWFQSVPAQKRPDTLAELEPLYRAVGHGCRAGLYKEARGVYEYRILRGDQECYSLFQLGAISADLSALAGFFPAGWGAPPVTGDLSEADRSWFIADVAYCLLSLGRLGEALGPQRMRLEWCREAGDWDNFCVSSYNLVDLQTPLGSWREAEQTAREAVEAAWWIADGSQAPFNRLAALAHLGRALHGQGRLADSKAAFAEAEALQAQLLPQLPTLYGLSCFGYDQLLLEQAREAADRRAALDRARASLAYEIEIRHLLSQALDHCTIGQALAALGDPADEPEAAAALDLSIATARRASAIQFMPILHLARAHHRRDRHQGAAARADLDTALAIARRGGMRTYLAECALLAGHLHLDADPPEVPDAAKEWATADQFIRADGYGRREAELSLLQARLLHRQGRPDEARAALERAQARIRAIGQWGLWPSLHRVAAELGLSLPPDPP